MMGCSQMIDECLRSLASRSDVFVLQVGAADGIQGDLVHSFLTTANCSALLLEPVPELYQRLLQTYAEYRRIRCAQLAIGREDGELTLFRIRDCTGLPRWAEQLASIHLHVIKSHSELIPELRDRIMAEKVPCLTIDTLCDRFNIDHIDLAAIDTEGFDLEIIHQILDIGQRPAVLLFEHKHVCEDEYEKLAARLHAGGYTLHADDSDTLCQSNSFRQNCSTTAAMDSEMPARGP